MFTRSTHRMPRFGTTARVLRTSDAAGLAESAIQAVAPSVFAGNKHQSRSERYTYTPTIDVLRHLRNDGFIPMEVRQSSSRIEGKAEFTKHMLRLRFAGALTVGETVNEIVLINSHDGTSSHQLLGGVFRVVCSNGLIVMEGPGTALRIPHTGDANSLVLDGCVEILNSFPRIAADIEGFKSTPLTVSEQRVFAKAALQVRYPTADIPPITPDEALKVRRIEDTPSTLWHTLNVVQENTMRGGQRYVSRVADGALRRGTTREVRGIDNTVSLNRALWTLATELKALKEAQA